MNHMEVAHSSAREVASSCLRARNNEAAATLQLRIMLWTGKLSQIMNVPPVERHVFEYRIPGVGIADLVVFHPGGGLTLVEAKGPEDCRAVAAGIGQLFMYEAGVRRQLTRAGKPPPFVNRILCAPVTPEEAQPAWEACQLAGVRFVHLCPLERLQAAAAQDLQALGA
jgi:hypothetical protein